MERTLPVALSDVLRRKQAAFWFIKIFNFKEEQLIDYKLKEYDTECVKRPVLPTNRNVQIQSHHSSMMAFNSDIWLCICLVSIFNQLDVEPGQLAYALNCQLIIPILVKIDTI